MNCETDKSLQIFNCLKKINNVPAPSPLMPKWHDQTYTREILESFRRGESPPIDLGRLNRLFNQPGALLNEGLSAPNYPSDYLPDVERCQLDRPSSIREYKGGVWYYQGTEPTCAAWAIANACLASGIGVPMDVIEELATQARSKKGLHLMIVQKLVNARCRGAFTLVGANFGFLRHCSIDKTRIINDNASASQAKLDREEYGPVTSQIIFNLNRGRAIVASVHFEDSESSHAICIAGYRIDDDGYLYLQVIDSNRGIVWVPAEQLIRIINYQSAFFVKKYDQAKELDEYKKKYFNS